MYKSYCTAFILDALYQQLPKLPALRCLEIRVPDGDTTRRHDTLLVKSHVKLRCGLKNCRHLRCLYPQPRPTSLVPKSPFLSRIGRLCELLPSPLVLTLTFCVHAWQLDASGPFRRVSHLQENPPPQLVELRDCLRKRGGSLTLCVIRAASTPES